jgi:hypothetical protein
VEDKVWLHLAPIRGVLASQFFHQKLFTLLNMVCRKFVQNQSVCFGEISKNVEITNLLIYGSKSSPFFAFGLARSGQLGWLSISAGRVRSLARLRCLPPTLPAACQQASKRKGRKKKLERMQGKEPGKRGRGRALWQRFARPFAKERLLALCAWPARVRKERTKERSHPALTACVRLCLSVRALREARPAQQTDKGDEKKGRKKRERELDLGSKGSHVTECVKCLLNTSSSSGLPLPTFLMFPLWSP